MNQLFLEGLQAYKEGRYADAVTILKRAVAESPDNSNYLYYLGCSQAQNNQPEEAIESLSQALERVDAVPIRYMRGEIALNSGKQEEALADFTAIIENCTSEYRYWKSLSFLGRGLIHLEQGDIEEAMSDFTISEDIAREEGDSSLLARIAATLEINGF